MILKKRSNGLILFFFLGLEELIGILRRMTSLPDRNVTGDLLFSVDHCFNIRGQGTVMTGTVLQGAFE